MNYYDHFLFRRAAATFMALLLAIPSFELRAGDLNSEVNNMFNNLGAIGIRFACGLNACVGTGCAAGQPTGRRSTR